MFPMVGLWLDKRREAKRIDKVLRVMSLKVFTNQGSPSLEYMKTIGAWATGGNGSKDASVVIHANQRTSGNITHQPWHV
jgi:hypothetical protein